MSPVVAQRRMSDAPDLSRQGLMLDAQRRGEQTRAGVLPEGVDWVEQRLVAGASESLRAGTLVSVGGGADGFVQRAGGALAADGVVIVGGEGAVQWARRAVLWLPLGTPTASGAKVLWLTGRGTVGLSGPASGPAQRVGTALRRDTARGLWQCLIECGGKAAQVPAGWPWGIEDFEVPAETVDGSQTNFSTMRTYLAGSLVVWMNRLMQVPGVDFTEDTDRMGYTMAVAPPEFRNKPAELWHGYRYSL